MKVYPIFLNNLEQKQCFVLGGNDEAEKKVEGLLACDARVTLISGEVTEGLERMASAKRVQWIAREYRKGDLAGAFLVIAIRKDPETNRAIFEEAEAGNALVNVMDDIPNCNFVAGSVVRRGPLAISISTSGAAPALAVRIREHMESQFGPEYGTLLDLLQKLREPMAAHHPDFETRKKIWYALVDSDALRLLGEGRHQDALNTLQHIAGFEIAKPTNHEPRTLNQ